MAGIAFHNDLPWANETKRKEWLNGILLHQNHINFSKTSQGDVLGYFEGKNLTISAFSQFLFSKYSAERFTVSLHLYAESQLNNRT